MNYFKIILFSLLGVCFLKSQEVPEDLIGDEHVREEFGVNRFTTPSIKKLFEQLDELGELPYAELKREIPKTIPRERTLVALGLGTLISDGFLVVQSEEIEELENIGRAVLKQAQVLGAGKRVTKYTKSILENSVLGKWDKLKEELSKTQADVEAEMVMLRDVDIANLVALGGWIRAFEIAAVTTQKNYSNEKAVKLARTDLIAYFVETLQGLEPKLRERAHLIQINKDLESLLASLGGHDPESENPQPKIIPTKEDVAELAKKARAILAIIESSK
ncbi:MAG: hypothetical protein CMO36_06270 [Verrucomicrobiaceae bacterium]|jgi:hypothetical protein|nr:hypothetical protein [Verrucomicrobiaceae bacterium]|tara:strand:- start:758 stop:1585 length:828 start_codon:yes stop_codon:yes gene_type:complete